MMVFNMYLKIFQMEFLKSLNSIQQLIKLNPISSVLIIIIGLVLIKFLIKKILNFKRICDIMKNIPGPPSHFLLGNAILVLYLDKFNFKHGTYVLLFQMATAVNLLFGKFKICKMWLGFKPFVILFTPESIETVLTNNNLTIKAEEYDFLKPWLGEGLVTSNGKKWRMRRKMLTPTFHFKILLDFLPIMNEHCIVLIDKLYSLSIDDVKIDFKKLDKYIYNNFKFEDDKSKSINYYEEPKNKDKIYDIVPIVTLFTLDVICETAMGVHLNLQREESDYINCIQEVEKFFLWRLTRPWLWFDFLYKLTNDYKENNRCIETMRTFTYSVIDKRKNIWLNYLKQYSKNHEIKNDNEKSINQLEDTTTNNNKKSIDDKNDNNFEEHDFDKQQSNEDRKFQDFFTGTKTRLAFLDLLLQQHFKDPQNFTIDDIKEESDTFMFAGHDTTAYGISWTIYMLGRYPEIQQKVRDEVDEIIDKNDSECTCKHKITFNSDQLKEMKYLECVLKEVQRIYPTAPFFGRRVTEDVHLADGYTIPTGSTVAIFTYAMHRNAELYPNPLKFDPDRFLPENVADRHPYAFIPFSAGLRNCIGQKFSGLEQKLVIAKLLRNFYFESTIEEDKLVIVGEMILKSKNGLPVKVYRRFKEEERYCRNCIENYKDKKLVINDAASELSSRNL